VATSIPRRRKRRSGRPVKRAETIASTAILTGLAAIFLTVYLVGSSGETRSLSGAESAWGGEMDILPPSLEPLVLTGTWTYGPDNLYEYINGQAPHYLQFGFRAVMVGEYSEDAGAMPEIIVDLYDMAERSNAYGLFMESFPPEEELAPLGNDGFYGYNVAAFWKGPYYVRVMALTAEDQSYTVHAAAEMVAERIQDEESGLTEFAAFPTEGLLPGTLGFSKVAAFGLHYMKDTFLGSYEGEESVYRLFYSDLEREEEALELVAAHRDYLGSAGELSAVEEGAQEELVWGEHPYIGAILMIRRGNLVVGSVRLAGREAAEGAVRGLLQRVEEES
jgi:hypothetical protein